MNKIIRNILLTAAALTALVACGKDPKGGSTLLRVVPSTEVIQANGVDVVTFAIEYDGIDVTSSAELFTADGATAALTFSTETPGSYSFYARYNNEQSPAVTVTAIESTLPEIPADPNPSSTDFARKVMVVEFTGTGCTYCPVTIAALDEVAKSPLRTSYVLVACHSRYTTDPAYFNGPLFQSQTPGSVTPYVTVDLDESLSYEGASATVALLAQNYRTLISSAINKRTAKAAIAASTTVSGNSVVVSMSVKAASTEEYKVGVWLLEDDIYGQQTMPPGMTGDYDYHDDCLRSASYTGSGSSADFTGVSLGTINAGETAEYTTAIQLDSNWKLDNCHLVLFVSAKDSDGKFYVNNVTGCEIGGTVAYQYK